MSLIDRLARQPIGRLAALIVITAVLSLLALVLSVRTATTQAGVARAQADKAIAESRQNSLALVQAVCTIADTQRVHVDDPTEPKPTTPRGIRSAAAWQLLYESQGCEDVPPSPLPSSSTAQPAPTPTG